jgi:hypothetical protein
MKSAKLMIDKSRLKQSTGWCRGEITQSIENNARLCATGSQVATYPKLFLAGKGAQFNLTTYP